MNISAKSMLPKSLVDIAFVFCDIDLSTYLNSNHKLAFSKFEYSLASYEDRIIVVPGIDRAIVHGVRCCQCVSKAPAPLGKLLPNLEGTEVL